MKQSSGQSSEQRSAQEGAQAGRRLKVQVWIYCLDAQDRPQVLLLLTNARRKSFWQPVTGSVDPGEGLEAAAVREAREETGLTFLSTPVSLGDCTTFETYGMPCEEHPFALTCAQGRPAAAPAVKIDPEEHADYRWVSPEEAHKMLKFKWNAEVLDRLLEVLSRKHERK